MLNSINLKTQKCSDASIDVCCHEDNKEEILKTCIEVDP
jgi:hypothetical protein